MIIQIVLNSKRNAKLFAWNNLEESFLPNVGEILCIVIARLLMELYSIFPDLSVNILIVLRMLENEEPKIILGTSLFLSNVLKFNF